MDLLLHPDELLAVLRLKWNLQTKKSHLDANTSADLRWCYDMLSKVSRSFAMVIKELSPELRDPVCIFYLVLRGLDTIEDDMSIDVKQKVELMTMFPRHLEKEEGEESLWNIKREGILCGKDDEKVLLEEFHRVINVHRSLKQSYRDIICDITRKMSAGMQQFLMRKQVDGVSEYNLYCHYVAGLVGIGLSKMFAESGLEDVSFASSDALSNSMGLFLQKTNIIRDYLEDMNDGRIFWPKEIWSLYTDKLENFKSPEHFDKGLACMNHLIGDALSHSFSALQYLEKLQERNNFNFCAIPQVMAIATLALCYDNPNVFTSVVKMRRGLTVKMVVECQDYGMTAVYSHFYQFAREILNKLNRPENKDPQKESTRKVLEEIIAITSPHVKNRGDNAIVNKGGWYLAGFVSIAAVVSYFVKSRLVGQKRLQWK